MIIFLHTGDKPNTCISSQSLNLGGRRGTTESHVYILSFVTLRCRAIGSLHYKRERERERERGSLNKKKRKKSAFTALLLLIGLSIIHLITYLRIANSWVCSINIHSRIFFNYFKIYDFMLLKDLDILNKRINSDLLHF